MNNLVNFDEEEIDEKLKINLLAQRIGHLLQFAGSLIPELETLEKLHKDCEERENFALSAAPLIAAYGLDYEQKHFEAELHKKRAEALVNLVKVLRNTEMERQEWNESRKVVEEGREWLKSML